MSDDIWSKIPVWLELKRMRRKMTWIFFVRCSISHEPFPAPSGIYTIETEQNSVTHATHQLLISVPRILSHGYPDIQFAVASEVHNDVEVIVSEQHVDVEEDEDDYATVHRMWCRLDQSIKSCRIGEEHASVILIIEHKRPGLLHCHDWTIGFTTRTASSPRNPTQCNRVRPTTP